eukprot:Skav210829  [mRNA]  locus=scaffold1597:415542:419159:+ [translate_table: standard]
MDHFAFRADQVQEGWVAHAEGLLHHRHGDAVAHLHRELDLLFRELGQASVEGITAGQKHERLAVLRASRGGVTAVGAFEERRFADLLARVRLGHDLSPIGDDVHAARDQDTNAPSQGFLFENHLAGLEQAKVHVLHELADKL